MGVDETIQVRCSRCKGKFRDRAGRIRDGYSRQCPSCERLMFFAEGSPNKDIHDAMREAQRVRKLLRQEQDEQKPAVIARDDDEHTETAPALSRRIERRVRPGGRES